MEKQDVTVDVNGLDAPSDVIKAPGKRSRPFSHRESASPTGDPVGYSHIPGASRHGRASTSGSAERHVE